MSHSNAFIGLDTHNDAIAIAIAGDGRDGEDRYYGQIANEPAAVLKLVKKLSGKYGKLFFNYEAGPRVYDWRSWPGQSRLRHAARRVSPRTCWAMSRPNASRRMTSATAYTAVVAIRHAIVNRIPFAADRPPETKTACVNSIRFISQESRFRWRRVTGIVEDVNELVISLSRFRISLFQSGHWEDHAHR
jgi:hypothetical protein